MIDELLAKFLSRGHMRRRESGGRLRSPIWSGPEGSSHNGLRRVARLLRVFRDLPHAGLQAASFCASGAHDPNGRCAPVLEGHPFFAPARAKSRHTLLLFAVRPYQERMGDSPDTYGNETQQGEAAPTVAELEAAGQSALFGGDPAPAPPAARPVAANQPYRVLARKYRPQTFSQLIGQDAMVQTLANGIKRERLAHAFLMTGVRGVGKTSTARLIAKARSEERRVGKECA